MKNAPITITPGPETDHPMVPNDDYPKPYKVKQEGRRVGVTDAKDAGTKDENAITIAPEKKSNAVWSQPEPKLFTIVHDIQDDLVPGFYECLNLPNIGYCLKLLDISDSEDLVDFDPTADKVVEDIEYFWESKDKFKEFGFTHKRGILLYGPPGTGKSTVNKKIIKKVIENDGFAINFDDPVVFINAVRMLRNKHPDVPIVAIMEDLDSLIKKYDASRILNILDGVSGFENIIYLATTNYPEELEERFSNRPSRFDKRYRIGYPSIRSRKIYFDHLATRVPSLTNLNVNWLVKNSKGFTIAHLKELFISVAIFGNSHKDALESLNKMKKGASSNDDSEEQKGFGIGFGISRDDNEEEDDDTIVAG